MRTRYALGLRECVDAAVAALDEAAARDWRITIALVDDGGHVLHLSRMDEASPASVDTAIAKARSAAMTGLDTAVLEKMVESRPAVATLGRVAVEGGLPLLHEGQRVGGVGVSGRQSHEDRVIAEIACAAIAAAWSGTEAKG